MRTRRSVLTDLAGRVVGAAWGLGAASVRAPDFLFWTLSARGLSGPESPVEIPAGSLQKPFVVRAWTRTHPAEALPNFTCTPESGCWRPSGHGTLDLRGALRESCNTWFRQLARECALADIEDSLREAGFHWHGGLTEAETIGLPGLANVRVTPPDLLRSFARLIRAPWSTREDVREELLEGLRDSAEEGTAEGLALHGYLAKTGTVPALDGRPLRTSGLVLVTDAAGFTLLGLLSKGTGREAAARARVVISDLRPGSLARSTDSRFPRRAVGPSRSGAPIRSTLEAPVRVRLFAELRLAELSVFNEGSAPVMMDAGFLGPGARARLEPGRRFGEGLWRFESTSPAFTRRLRGSFEAVAHGERITALATMTARDYANGVLRAELGKGGGALRPRLTSAVLRFLNRGARHPDAHVCDSTHCAWFVGEGPVPRWIRPAYAVADASLAGPLSDVEWSTALREALAQPRGPAQWTSHCGGDPVSPHFVWGGGDRAITPCPRHARGSGRVWRREWADAELERIFGRRPRALSVAVIDGQWFLRIEADSGLGATSRASPLSLTFDDAHQRLASRLGWDALPAPAARITRTASGFVAEGVGFGHRVGLCLAP